MSEPTCDYCERPYADARGCEYRSDLETPWPVRYGEEQNPISSSPACRDCGAPLGTLHHVTCLCTECPSCHRQFHGGMSCEEDRVLVTGGTAA